MTFRQYKTSIGKQVLLGKSAETNEELVSQIGRYELVFHSSKPGSPFANVKSSEGLSKKEIYEVAIMCAKHSQDWRDNKRDVKVHYFLWRDVYKTKGMSVGTFGVKKFKNINVKKADILGFEEGRGI